MSTWSISYVCTFGLPHIAILYFFQTFSPFSQFWYKNYLFCHLLVSQGDSTPCLPCTAQWYPKSVGFFSQSTSRRRVFNFLAITAWRSSVLVVFSAAYSKRFVFLLKSVATSLFYLCFSQLLHNSQIILAPTFYNDFY